MDTSFNDAIGEYAKAVQNKQPNFSKVITDQQHEIIKAENDARGKLTTFFVRGFFLSLLGGFFCVLLYNYCAINWIESLHAKGLSDEASKITLLELDKVLSIIITALGTSLGFIIGYYFKEKKG
uniref:Uncharacterized protein n=1 Tax=Providencia stuartii TaxID=588 RepID=A0AAI9DB57_PROST|nr:hypothetical protein [Providencia stuartii]